MLTASTRPPATRFALLAILLGGLGCESRSPTPPDGLRFGQIGSVTVEVVTPISLGEGTLRQVLEWNSDGFWTLEEAISYRELLGDSNLLASAVNPEVSAGLYAQWITQVNDLSALDLFVPDLDPTLNPSCTLTESRLTLTIQDDARRESTSWTRCGSGPLGVLDPLGSGPDLGAARVFAATQFARDFTVGTTYNSPFRGTIPFGTLDRGERSGAALSGPLSFTDEHSWLSFWQEHAGTTPPAVDFEKEVVLVATVGQRTEAGTTVEVRRVLPVQAGSFIETVEQVPGDFCSPASLRITPYHIVVAPRIPDPIRYTDVRVELKPCG